MHALNGMFINFIGAEGDPGRFSLANIYLHYWIDYYPKKEKKGGKNSWSQLWSIFNWLNPYYLYYLAEVVYIL